MNEVGIYDPCVIFPIVDGEDGAWYHFLPLADIEKAISKKGEHKW